MGRALDVSCDGCDLELRMAIGFGFIGIESRIVVCESCRTVGTVKVSVFQDSQPVDLGCRRCGQHQDQRWPRAAGSDVSGNPIALGACPKCGGSLSGKDSGIFWD